MIPLKDIIPSGRFPWLTFLLIASNAWVFLQELVASSPDDFMARYALVPHLVHASDPSTYLPFLTAIFLHAGFLHLGSNMLFLWVFGNQVEARLGGGYLALYLLGGVIGNLAQYWTAPDSTLPILGASGAIAAVLGAYWVWFGSHRIRTLLFVFFFVTLVDLPAWIMLAYWFFIQLFSGLASISSAATEGGVAYFAHVGGFLAGVVLAQVLGRPAPPRQEILHPYL